VQGNRELSTVGVTWRLEVRETSQGHQS
jgi:hypothetical protein